jgi:transcriptional regulator with XRE-family HTH domain
MENQQPPQQPQGRPGQTPHRSLGRYLKTMRQRLQESLGETSGAVEIAVEQLDRFERGSERPSEDILLLLISHFGLQDDEAVKVWELAGYDTNSPQFAEANGFYDDDDQPQDTRLGHEPVRRQSPIMLVALDGRILYTNGVNITGDGSGLVLNFLQTEGAGQQHTYPVSRVGMSYEQAEQLLVTLQKALLHKKYMGGPKQIPPQTDREAS